MKEQETISRRKFLAYIGTSAAAIAVASSGLGGLTAKADSTNSVDNLFKLKTNKISDNFKAISPIASDELVLPKGYKYDVVAAFGDTINLKGETLGFNNDFIFYFPIDNSNVKGLIWVNHASSDPLWVQGAKQKGQYSADQVKQLLYNQGGSVIGVYRDKAGVWTLDLNSANARRITGLDAIELVGPARGSKAVKGATSVMGTFANSSGGKTLWNTVITCEGNVADTQRDAGLEQTHYGWAVEVDPFDSAFKARKHTALGRFQHGSIAMGLTQDQKVAVYMGDISTESCIYKFISKNSYDAAKGNANSALLDEGTLYAASMEIGKWIPLTTDAVIKALNDLYYKVPEILNQTREDLLVKFQESSDVYVYAKEAAILLGATLTDQPADFQIAQDHSIYIANTNNLKHGNLHGQITRFIEAKEDLGATSFSFETYASGGRQSGFSEPGNLTMDNGQGLWVTSLISPEQLNKGAWSDFKNNGMFVVGNGSAVKAKQFASAPINAALSGPSFTPDERTLFLSVKQPGANSTNAAKATSSWPHRKGDSIPRPGIVAISGFVI
jgi:secreted PhoX family phosphatase